MTTDDHQLYLASRSPRRGELLAQIGVRFATIVADVDERRIPGEPPEGYVERLALEKARAGHRRLETGDVRPVLGADTAVVLDGRILGKPRDREEAGGMSRLLAGREHRVLTAVALKCPGGESLALSASRVRFREISAEEIDRYWSTGEPVDKAGGYGIQGFGALFVSALEGSYSGVMGLPLFETGQLLERAGIELMPPGLGRG